MRLILFRWRGLTVWSYPALVYLGMVAGVVAGNVAAHAAGVDALRVFAATFVLMAVGLMGARLAFVASHWKVYREDVRRIWNRNEGGAAHYGGIAAVLPLSVPLLAALRLPWGTFWDVAAFTMLFILFFGRIGCLLNGCCAGRPSRGWLSAYLPNHLGVWERRIPAQILEAGWAAVLLVLGVSAWGWRPFPGALFLLLTGGYASGRLVLLSTREAHPGAIRLRIHQAFSVLLIVLSLAGLAARWPK